MIFRWLRHFQYASYVLIFYIFWPDVFLFGMLKCIGWICYFNFHMKKYYSMLQTSSYIMISIKFSSKVGAHHLFRSSTPAWNTHPSVRKINFIYRCTGSVCISEWKCISNPYTNVSYQLQNFMWLLTFNYPPFVTFINPLIIPVDSRGMTLMTPDTKGYVLFNFC